MADSKMQNLALSREVRDTHKSADLADHYKQQITRLKQQVQHYQNLAERVSCEQRQ